MSRKYYEELFRTTIETSKYNWFSIVQKIDGFIKFVEDHSKDLPEEVPIKDRIYAVFNKSSPVCEHGRLRTLKNINDGWKGCGRTGACLCAKALLSTNIKETKRRTKEEASEAVLSVEIEELSDGRSRLENIIANTPPKLAAQVAMDDPVVQAWVYEQCKYVRQTSTGKFSELMYLALNGPDKLTCKYGEQKTFNTFDKGYRFCANDCRCRREEQSEKITEHQSQVTPEERQRRIESQRSTMLSKHGVENGAHVNGAMDKRKKTSMEKYGYEHAQSAPDIKEKQASTNSKRYGGPSPSCNPVVLEKMKKTNLERYGSPDTTHLARAAFKDQTGFDNPFMMPEYQALAKQTMLEKYGVEHALRVPEFLKKMVSNTKNVFSNTKGEKFVERWLIINNIGYEKQYQILPNPHPYDFYLPEYNTIIEFDGAHHWNRKFYGRMKLTEEETEVALAIQEEKDRRRNEYAVDSGYKIVVVFGDRVPGDSDHGTLEEQFEQQGFKL